MISFKPITSADQAFVEAVYRSTREAELQRTSWTEEQKQAFIIMQSMAQLADYKRNNPTAAYEIILYNKKPAGRIFWVERETEIALIDLALLPRFQGKGIGKTIIEQVQQKAARKNKAVTLSVLKGNPAKRLYERLGFKKVDDKNNYEYLAWRST